MNHEMLKQKIETNTLDNEPLILVYNDDKFITNSYVNKIAEIRNLNKVYITDVRECLQDDDSFDNIEDTLYIYDVNKLTEVIDSSYKNLIVVTKSVDVDLDIDYIEMVKPVNEDYYDYVKYRVPGLQEAEVNWLCKVTKFDTYRIENECNKLALFPEGSQSDMFRRISSENGYADLTENNIFIFCDAIMNLDYAKVGELIPEINEADLEPLGCVTILLKKFKQKLEFLFNPKATATSCKMTDKQFYFLKNHPEKYTPYSREAILRNIKFLTNLDYKIKNGDLDLSREKLLDYIVSNIMC